METQLGMKLQMNYLPKDNWVYLQKRGHVISLSYKVLHVQQ